MKRAVIELIGVEVARVFTVHIPSVSGSPVGRKKKQEEYGLLDSESYQLLDSEGYELTVKR